MPVFVLRWTSLLLTISVLPVTFMTEDSENNEASEQVSAVIQTRSGPVQGVVRQTEGGENVTAFYGIPYAQSPISNLRFKPPRNVEPWTSVLRTTTPRAPCYQQFSLDRVINQQIRNQLERPWSEDCLHLNIWSPNPKPLKAPVIFFIHGGAFILGSGLMMVDGTSLASNGVVMVSANYRLGAFGFFSLGNAEAPGNVGLMDQNLALQWVRENIEAFGGDPDKITLAGMSAGSASVGYHLLSPKSRGLFKRAIMMSGAPTNFWANAEPEEMRKKSQNLLESLGCQLPDQEASLRCLRERHPEDIVDSCKGPRLLEDNFVPSVDGEFLTEHPSVSVASGRFNPAEVLVGTAADEGAWFMMTYHGHLFKGSDGRLSRRDYEHVLRKSVSGLSDLQSKTLDIAYTDWSNEDDPNGLRDAAKNVYNDAYFVCHINEFADRLSRKETVYRYVYDYKSAISSTFSPQWIGAEHGTEQVSLLIPEQTLKQFPPEDVQATHRFRQHILNFVKKGDPNIGPEEFPGEPAWPKYDARRQTLYFSSKSRVAPVGRQRECATWLELIPLLRYETC